MKAFAETEVRWLIVALHWSSDDDCRWDLVQALILVLPLLIQYNLAFGKTKTEQQTISEVVLPCFHSPSTSRCIVSFEWQLTYEKQSVRDSLILNYGNCYVKSLVYLVIAAKLNSFATNLQDQS